MKNKIVAFVKWLMPPVEPPHQNIWALALLLALVVPARAASVSQYQGKLDLGSSIDAQAIVDRDFTYGLWRGGMAYQAWHLQNNATNAEVFHVSAFWETGMDGKNEIYGARVGVNLTEAALAAVSKIEVLVPAVENIGVVLPPFVGKLGSFTSLDLGAAWVPGNAHVSAIIGGKVTIPLSMLYAWANGSNGQRGL
jgi:hypothetical protein